MADVGPNMGFLPFTAGGDIKPATIVKLSSLGDFTVMPAGAADVPFGVASEWTEFAPGTPFDNGFVATAGKPIMVYGPGSIARAAQKANAGAITPGRSVGPDANSEMVQKTTGWAVGWLLEGGDASKSQRLRVFVFPHQAVAGGS